jgi:hypothetical protein
MSEVQGGGFKDAFIGSLIGAGVSAGFRTVLGWTLLYNQGISFYYTGESVAFRTAMASISGGAASVFAGGKFADGAYSVAGFTAAIKVGRGFLI